MGDFKDINDGIYDRLIQRLEEEGYEDITVEQNNSIVDCINGQEDSEAFEDLVNYVKTNIL